jgi:hypothetical protein
LDSEINKFTLVKCEIIETFQTILYDHGIKSISVL